MGKRLSWHIEVSASGSDTVSVTRTQALDAIDLVEVEIPADGPAEHEVEVQPGSTDELRFLLIYADDYSDDLTYALSSGGTAIVLDQPHLFSGAGAVGLFASVPQSLFVVNGTGDARTLKVMAGRLAVS